MRPLGRIRKRPNGAQQISREPHRIVYPKNGTADKDVGYLTPNVLQGGRVERSKCVRGAEPMISRASLTFIAVEMRAGGRGNCRRVAPMGEGELAWRKPRLRV